MRGKKMNSKKINKLMMVMRKSYERRKIQKKNCSHSNRGSEDEEVLADSFFLSRTSNLICYVSFRLPNLT